MGVELYLMWKNNQKNICVVLTVHNTAHILNRVLDGIKLNTSDSTKEVIVILDGCTDECVEIVEKYSFNNKIMKVIETDNVWEVKANNIGIKETSCDFSLIIQDDMVLL